MSTQTPFDLSEPVDTLGEALHFLRVDGLYYCRSELCGRWGASVPAMPDHLWFHVVTHGHAWLDTEEEGQAHELQPGVLAVIPQGGGHRLWSEPGADTPDVLQLAREQVSDRYEILRHGDGDGNTTMICGALRLSHPAARNLIAALPPTLVIDALHSPQFDWMQSTLSLMAAETQQMRPGGEAVITRLGDILVVQAIRAWIETDSSTDTGWLGALKDRQIGRAIALIHRDPERPWTVAELAGAVAMSRSSFAARFTDLVGESVMRYVTRWRMYLAMEALAEHGATVAQVADRLGYQSEAAFSRAFKRVTALSPGAVRRGSGSPERPAMAPV